MKSQEEMAREEITRKIDEEAKEQIPEFMLGHLNLREKNASVNHPKHYTSHPSGIECIQVTEHMGFCLGNAIKYIWRADHKGNDILDLEKARWYIDREIGRRKLGQGADGELSRE